MMKLLCVPLLLLPSVLQAQLVGAFETFTHESNANSWVFYDYFTGTDGNPPLWKREGSEADPEIWAEFTQDAGVSLYANQISSDGFLVGDYLSAGVVGIFTNVFVEDTASFDSFEFYFVSDGVLYYSNYFEVDTPGWSTAENSFRDNEWYIGVDTDDDGFIDEFVLTPITDDILQSVSEIGLNFFPNSTAANGKDVGLDNFTLLADLTPADPVLKTGSSSGTYSFMALPGIQYTAEESPDLRESGWSEVEPPFEGDGSTYTHAFSTTMRRFLRLNTEVLYTEVPEVTP